MNENLYPPSVRGAPPSLTVPNAAYRRQVVIVLICLFIFVLFYLGLVIASGGALLYGLIEGFTTPVNEYGRSDSKAYFGIAVMAGVFFIFLVKALFKWSSAEQDMRIEITRQEHPELFRFIQNICDETKAPFPYRVFVTPDVNASVFYNSSLLSLIFPVKKNLIIGLGLVNGLNLSEFKAVLAHEFGHFSQSSMRLGSYVYMANRIIYDLVYHRDAFDDALAKAKRLDLRIAIFAWLIWAVLWVLRKILQGAFHAINFFQSALSRQMEFHADLVAVSITGSDSLIHALKKLEFSNACLMQSFGDLKAASEHKLYTQDIYYHQTMAADYLRRLAREPEAGTVPPLPADPKQTTQLFATEEDANLGGMWASHPSHFDREKNAKRLYLRSIEDERSPWLLFQRPEELRRQMTVTFYRHMLELENATYTPSEQVQQFIDDEHSETMQDERYEGMYDGRLLTIPTDQLIVYANDPQVPAISPAQIEALLKKLYNAEYKDWMEAHEKRREEHLLLLALDRGDAKPKGGKFEFRGQQQKKADIKPLLQSVEQEIEADEKWLKAFDREVFQTHLRMAQFLHEGDQDLYTRYEFHLNLQDILRTARQEEFRLHKIFEYLASKEEGLTEDEMEQTRNGLKAVHASLQTIYDQSCLLALPALQNMQRGMPLNEYLLEEPVVHPIPYGNKIDGTWVATVAGQISQIESRSRRLYYKSMGAILKRQEAIADLYRSRSQSKIDIPMFDLSGI